MATMNDELINHVGACRRWWPNGADALLAVLDLHSPVERREVVPARYEVHPGGWAAARFRDAYSHTVIRCNHCVEWTNMGQGSAPWPCDTVTAIAKALGVL